MGDENPIRTLGDYSKPSHEGYRNTIELPVGNNVVPLRSDTIRLVQNGCSFHGLRSEDPNQHLKDFLKLAPMTATVAAVCCETRGFNSGSSSTEPRLGTTCATVMTRQRPVMIVGMPWVYVSVKALVQRLINEDKGRQDVLLNLAFQFEDSCAVGDDLRKAYEKCNDISQEKRALIFTLLKESSEKDRKLHLSMSSSLAVTSSGLSSDVSDAGSPSEKVMSSGKNGDDGDLLLFRDGPGACDISAGALRLFISWECSRPVAGVEVSPSSGDWVA
ncbi:hypothetical protein Tco_0708086 [Tanacetum coccineum]